MMKKLSSILFLLMFCSFTDVSGQKISYGNYCNTRFTYCLEYPNFLIPQPESGNGDGRIFLNDNNQEILRVFGRFNFDAEGETITLEKQFNNDLKSFNKEKATVTYKKLGKAFFVISGYRNGKIFYQKTILKNDAFAFALLEYSASEKEIYNQVSTSIFKSFK